MGDVNTQLREAIAEFNRKLAEDLAKFIYADLDRETDEETTTTRDVDGIGAHTLQELYAMNGNRFPFTAVKVSETGGKGPIGRVCTFEYFDLHPRYGRIVVHGGGYALLDRRAWQFADPDFEGEIKP